MNLNYLTQYSLVKGFWESFLLIPQNPYGVRRSPAQEKKIRKSLEKPLTMPWVLSYSNGMGVHPSPPKRGKRKWHAK